MGQGRMEVPSVNGDADKIRCANYETVLKWRIFFLFEPFLRVYIRCANKLTRYKQKGLVCTASLFVKQRFSMANGTFKMKMDVNRQGPRHMHNNCKNLNPPFFSLPTTFRFTHSECILFEAQAFSQDHKVILWPGPKLCTLLCNMISLITPTCMQKSLFGYFLLTETCFIVHFILAILGGKEAIAIKKTS